MLVPRILTALALLAVLLPALFHGDPRAFGVVTLALLTAGAWEWGRLNGLDMTGSLALGGACLGLCLASWWLGWLDQALAPFWLVAGAAWVMLVIALLARGVTGWGQVAVGLRLLGGVLALWVAWMAISRARVIGINFLLSVLVLVWVADIGAYFSGRAFGRRKLAPAISPGKSWEGVWGGMLGVLVLAYTWRFFDQVWSASVPSLYTRVSVQHAMLLPLVVVFMVAMSVCGDLVESLIKRAAGVKDSSGLLPGHGGVLDRVDALLPTLPAALMLVTILGG